MCVYPGVGLSLGLWFFPLLPLLPFLAPRSFGEVAPGDVRVRMMMMEIMMMMMITMIMTGILVIKKMMMMMMMVTKMMMMRMNIVMVMT
jgi:hypothetical protein